jgi:Uma2 family endonuclease
MMRLRAASESDEAAYAGLRMSADEFLRLPGGACNYELINGVVMMSPSPKPRHRRVAMNIATQIGIYLLEHPVGEVLAEIDVHLGRGPEGGDLVYRPELVFIRSERLRKMRDQISGAPDLVVEVVSRGSRRLDSETKKADYERCGVREYWLIDPERKAMAFYRLRGRRFVEISTRGKAFASRAVPGFVLDLSRVRAAFKPW